MEYNPQDSDFPKRTLPVLWIILGLFLFVIAAIFIFFNLNEEQDTFQEKINAKSQEGKAETSKIPIDPTCENAPDAQTGILCYGSLAVKNQDTRYCQHFPLDYQDYCETTVYYENAKLKNDPKICEKIKNQLGMDNCFMELGVLVGDQGICNLIKNRTKTDIGKGEISAHDECFNKIADSKNEPSLCAFIIGDNRRNNCYTVIATRLGNSSICNDLRGDYADYYQSQCYQLIARNNGDSSSCDSIVSEDSRRYCKDRAFLSEAINAKNVTPCHQISSEREILDKYYKIPDGTRTFGGVEYCYEEVMLKIKQAVVCGDIINDMKRRSCYPYIAKITKDPTQCNAASVADGREDCYKVA